MSSNEEYMDLLLSLGKFALLHNNVQLIEATRNLLKLIPSGIQLIMVFSFCSVSIMYRSQNCHKNDEILSGIS